MLRPVSELTPTPIEWLWPGYLAVGSLAILDGDPGLGKSLLTLDLAARLTTGRPWPDGTSSPGPASVVLLCDEDVESIIAMRLKSLGADVARTYLWPRLADPGLPRFPVDIDRLDAAIAETAGKLVIIDPIVAFLDRTVMMNSDANVRRALHSLALVAEKHRCVILMVRHLNKDDGPHALYRGGGSISFVAACRLGWLVGRDPRMAERLVLAQTKNNYSPRQPSLAYKLPKDALGVDWQGPSVWSADELAARRPAPSRRRARDFLRLFLEAAPRTTRETGPLRANTASRKPRSAAPRTTWKSAWSASTRDGQRFDYWLMPGQQVPADGVSETPVLDDWLRRWRELYPPQTPIDEGDGAR